MSLLYELLKDGPDFSYNPTAKKKFKFLSNSEFTEIRNHITRHEVIRPKFKLSFNAGGIGVDGDPSMKVLFENDQGVYLKIARTYTAPGGFAIMMRKIKGFDDHTGGENRWFNLDILNDYEKLHKIMREICPKE